MHLLKMLDKWDEIGRAISFIIFGDSSSGPGPFVLSNLISVSYTSPCETCLKLKFILVLLCNNSSSEVGLSFCVYGSLSFNFLAIEELRSSDYPVFYYLWNN